jgi:WD40 repeat protein
MSWVVTTSNGCDLIVWELATSQRTADIHRSSVSAIVVTPDGRRAVTGSVDCEIKVWDLASGRCEKTLTGHTKSISEMLATPDGRHVVSGSRDRTIRLWDLDSGACVRVLEGSTDDVVALALSPDGTALVAGCHDGSVSVWDLAGGGGGARLDKFDTATASLAVAPDGGWAVGCSADGHIKAWDLASKQCIVSLPGVGGRQIPDGSVAVTADGEWVVGYSLVTTQVVELGKAIPLERLVTMWNVRTGVCGRFSPAEWSGGCKALALAPDASRAFAGGRSIKLAVTGSPAIGPAPIGLDGSSVNRAAVTPDGRRMAVVCHDMKIRLLSLVDGTVVATLAVENRVGAMAMGPDGATIALGDQQGYTYLLHVENVASEPPLVTPWIDADGTAFGCPSCRRWSLLPPEKLALALDLRHRSLGISIPSLATPEQRWASLEPTLPCPRCGEPLTLNPFAIAGDWHAIDRAWSDGVGPLGRTEAAQTEAVQPIADAPLRGAAVVAPRVLTPPLDRMSEASVSRGGTPARIEPPAVDQPSAGVKLPRPVRAVGAIALMTVAIDTVGIAAGLAFAQASALILIVGLVCGVAAQLLFWACAVRFKGLRALVLLALVLGYAVAWAVVGSTLARLLNLAEPGPMVLGSAAAVFSLVVHAAMAAVAGLVGFAGGKR